MNMQWYDWVGIAGTLMILCAFYLLQAGRIHGNRITYQLLNLFGALGILVSLWGKFNVSVFLLEVAWVVVSLFGIVRSFRAQTGGDASA